MARQAGYTRIEQDEELFESFVQARVDGAKRADLVRLFGIAPMTVDNWLKIDSVQKAIAAKVMTRPLDMVRMIDAELENRLRTKGKHMQTRELLEIRKEIAPRINRQDVNVNVSGSVEGAKPVTALDVWADAEAQVQGEAQEALPAPDEAEVVDAPDAAVHRDPDALHDQDLDH